MRNGAVGEKNCSRMGQTREHLLTFTAFCNSNEGSTCPLEANAGEYSLTVIVNPTQGLKT